jgi:glycerol-3-phosphate acyltransferase PlsX
MIALDAMGGDHAPEAIVAGALLAARRGIPLRIYGDEDQIIPCLHSQDPGWHNLPITVVHCSQVIQMDDEPTTAVLRKKDSSLVQAMNDVASGKALAFVSAGNTGSCLVGGMLIVGKTPGILRPAIGEFIPTLNGEVFCIDLGANVDCKPEHLKQFAIMGDVYVKLKKQMQQPRIAFLSNGIERSKGNKALLASYELLESSGLNFIGNREPYDILHGDVDVLVCDGFVGNIMLKSLEAMVSLVPKIVERECRKSWWGRTVGFLGKRFFKKLKQNVARVQKGGALLLGVQKPIIIAHGSSQKEAIEDALVYAHRVTQSGFIEQFNNAVSTMIEKSVVYSNQLSVNFPNQH